MRRFSIYVLASLAATAGAAEPTDSIQPLSKADSTSMNVRDLGEIVVKADRYVRTAAGMTIRPDKNQTRHSSGGYELIRNLMIPGVSVDIRKGEVSALGGSVSLYVDGMAADIREIRQLRPEDVAKVEYIENPSGKYAGDNVALNFVMKKRVSGGYAAVDALQRAGYTNGDYNLAAKLFHGNTQYTLFTGTDYLSLSGAETITREEIRFPDHTVGREHISVGSRSRSDSQYAQLRVRDKNERRTLRATFNFVRNANPEDRMESSVTYTGLPEGLLSNSSSRNSSSRGFKYSLGLSGSFNLPRDQWMEASASATASRNDYEYLYGEGDVDINSFTKENFYNFTAALSYGINLRHGNSLVFKANEYYNVSQADYSGHSASWQHLWSSETLCFAEYSQPLGRKASLRLAPGFSAEVYRMHGDNRVVYAGPRMQMVFAMQPGRGQLLQLAAAYGNSFPQLGMLSGAVRQVDLIRQRRGNPDLKVSRMLNASAVYGLGIGKVQLQLSGIFMSADRMPISDYYFDDGMLVESFAADGAWREVDATLSATWTPSPRFNLQISGGWLYNRYLLSGHWSAACWKGGSTASWYIGDFSVNAHVATPRKIAGYDRRITRTIWQYGLSVSWNHKSLLVEIGADNPFSRHPDVRDSLYSSVFTSRSYSRSPSDRASAWVKLAWSIDFGKKTGHDRRDIDRDISTGILRAE